MAPIIAQTSSITAQNSYIYMLAELLPDFDYQQVEQAVNNSRLSNRKSQQEQVYQQPRFQTNLPLSKQVSRLVKAEITFLIE